MKEWHALLEQNKGGELTVTVCARKDGKWLQYQDFKIHVSPYALDEWGVTYRRIAPGYEVYRGGVEVVTDFLFLGSKITVDGD